VSTTESFFRARRVLTPEGLRPASIHVRAGKISRVAEFDDVPAGAPVIEAPGDAVLLPGVVDSHVHINEPGRTTWEGFATATAAAAAGGVTTLVDMPLNSIPPTTSVAALRAKVEASEGQCRVDFGLWGGAVPGNDGDLLPLLEAGALGFKCFMVDSGVDEFPHCREADLRAAMRQLADQGAPLLVHAELAGPIEAALAAGLGPPRSYSSYLRSRPRQAEDEAIALLLGLCREAPARLHVVHLSSASALPLLRAARDERLPISAETTPHYLHLAADEIPDGATAYKCAPPIRERDNREALWGALSEGLVSVVVTDHSPCTPELKRLELGDFAEAWGGIASLQLGLSIVWTEAQARGHSLAEVSSWLSAGPAALAGLDHRKGRLAPGLDADLVFFAPDRLFQVDADALLHRNKVTPYAGQTLRGVVTATYVRGEQVFGGGQLIGAPAGRWLRRGE
jgi:allantoinase